MKHNNDVLLKLSVLNYYDQIKSFYLKNLKKIQCMIEYDEK